MHDTGAAGYEYKVDGQKFEHVRRRQEFPRLRLPYESFIYYQHNLSLAAGGSFQSFKSNENAILKNLLKKVPRGPSAVVRISTKLILQDFLKWESLSYH